MSTPIGILGAGLTGLSAAWHLQRAGIPHRLLEHRATPGGYVRSVREGAYLRELGPNSLLLDVETRAFLTELGLEKEVLPANPVGNDRFVFRHGAYQRLPSGPLSLLLRSFFSLKTRLSVLRERSVKSRSPEGETLARFFERRFSREIVDYALDPFVGGIYAGDPRRLLVAETFPSLVAYEREYGSILKGFAKNRSGTRRESVSFRDGVQTLPNALAAQLDGVRYNVNIRAVQKAPVGWRVLTDDGEESFEKLVVTAPAFVCAAWFRESQPTFAEALDAVNYPPVTVVHTAFRRNAVRHPLRGFGGLNPGVEKRFAVGHLWSSSVFGHRCPPDEVLLTSFVGGTRAPDHARLPDADLFARLNAELREGFGTKGNPTFQRLFRWERAIPQYDADALTAQRMAAALADENLHFAVNWLDGISLLDGLKKGRALAEKLTAVR